VALLQQLSHQLDDCIANSLDRKHIGDFRPQAILSPAQGMLLKRKEVRQLAQLYREGVTVRELISQFGVCRTTVLDHLEREGISRRPNKRKMTDADVAEALKLHKQGLSANEIARRFEVHSNTIRNEFRKLSKN